jgi:hypothetical protein
MKTIFLSQKTKAFVEEKKEILKRSCRVFKSKEIEVFWKNTFSILNRYSK